MKPKDAARTFDVLLTAQEAYPRLEQEFLSAKSEIVAGFRIFDPWTKLRSRQAREQGDAWFDLLVHTLNRGVTITMTLTDFDPVVRMGEHRYAWQCLRAFIAAGEASAHPENLHVRVAMHPARVGLLPRIVLWLRSVKEINAQIDRLMDQNGIGPEKLIKQTPALGYLASYQDGQLRAKYLPPPPLVPVTHHQKLAVFDNDRLYIGGLDLNDRRFDTPEHRRESEETWHDVQVIVDGDVAREARSHLLTLDKAVAGKTVPKPRELLRTISAKRKVALPYLSPVAVVDELAQAHLEAVQSARALIYFETQFFREERLADCIAEQAIKMPDLNMIMMLPAAPEDIAFTRHWGPDAAFGEHLQVKCIEKVQDAFGDRVFIGAPAQPRSSQASDRSAHFGAPIIYLHAKVSIFDQQLGIVSSANLNGRSMNWDTEAGVATQNAEEAALLTQRCFQHWLGKDADKAFFDPRSACDAWAARAAANAQSAPEARIGFVLPYALEPAKADAQILPGVPPEMA